MIISETESKQTRRYLLRELRKKHKAYIRGVHYIMATPIHSNTHTRVKHIKEDVRKVSESSKFQDLKRSNTIYVVNI